MCWKDTQLYWNLKKVQTVGGNSSRIFVTAGRLFILTDFLLTLWFLQSNVIMIKRGYFELHCLKTSKQKSFFKIHILKSFESIWNLNQVCPVYSNWRGYTKSDYYGPCIGSYWRLDYAFSVWLNNKFFKYHVEIIY